MPYIKQVGDKVVGLSMSRESDWTMVRKSKFDEHCKEAGIPLTSLDQDWCWIGSDWWTQSADEQVATLTDFFGIGPEVRTKCPEL